MFNLQIYLMIIGFCLYIQDSEGHSFKFNCRDCINTKGTEVFWNIIAKVPDCRQCVGNNTYNDGQFLRCQKCSSCNNSSIVHNCTSEQNAKCEGDATGKEIEKEDDKSGYGDPCRHFNDEELERILTELERILTKLDRTEPEWILTELKRILTEIDKTEPEQILTELKRISTELDRTEPEQGLTTESQEGCHLQSPTELDRTEPEQRLTTESQEGSYLQYPVIILSGLLFISFLIILYQCYKRKHNNGRTKSSIEVSKESLPAAANSEFGSLVTLKSSSTSEKVSRSEKEGYLSETEENKILLAGIENSSGMTFGELSDYVINSSSRNLQNYK